ncbi:GDSL esterase/lipase EXL2 [Linum perenne]
MFSYASILLFCFTFLLFVIGPTTLELIKLPPGETVSASLVFGDSIFDTGNNNNLTSPAMSNFPPYGKDLNRRVPIKRFSNRKVPSNFLGFSNKTFSYPLNSYITNPKIIFK